MSGYYHANYAASLAEFGSPRLLARSGGWLLDRKIPGTSFLDAMGCYPLFACKDWPSLGHDLNELDGELVSVVAVSDPFAEADERLLLRSFRDFVRPYKEHFVCDLRQDPRNFVSRHHQRNVHESLKRIEIDISSEPHRWLDEWVELYANLARRHGIQGIAAFSRSSFARQLEVPGLTMFRAVHGHSTVGINLWFTHDDRAYYHLGAYSDVGYGMRASFGLFWTAIEHFGRAGIGWLGLGAGAGLEVGQGDDGLIRFKRGWATGTRTAYLCGRICDPDHYQQLALNFAPAPIPFFPAYRDVAFAPEPETVSAKTSDGR